jgi:hypothetical protein
MIWTELGLEATTDHRAIKRAYSQKLKTIDVDADPEAFIALRRAYDAALAAAARTEAPAIANAIQGTAAPLHVDPRQARDDEPPPEQHIRPTHAVNDNDLNRLAALLHGSEAISAIAPDVEMLIGKIVGQLPLEHIDRAAEIEWWLAATIARTSPRSDFLLASVIDHLKWERHEGALRIHPAIRAVLQRAADLEFRSRIGSPGYNWSRAYRTLSQQPPTGFRLTTSSLRKEIRSLLTVVRRDHPTLIGDFNEASVHWWAQRVMQRSPAGRLWAKIATRLPGGSRLWDPQPRRGRPKFWRARRALALLYFLFISRIIGNFISIMPDFSGYFPLCIASSISIICFFAIMYALGQQRIDRKFYIMAVGTCILSIFIAPPKPFIVDNGMEQHNQATK